MRLALLFKLLWPRFTKAYEYVLLGYNVAYLFDKTPYYRPWLHWLGVDLRRMSDQDYVSRMSSPARFNRLTLPFCWIAQSRSCASSLAHTPFLSGPEYRPAAKNGANGPANSQNGTPAPPLWVKGRASRVHLSLQVPGVVVILLLCPEPAYWVCLFGWRNRGRRRACPARTQRARPSAP